MIKIWKRALKRLDIWDIGLTKFAVAAFTLFVIMIWPAAMTWVHTINPWYFFAAFVVIVARPVYRGYIKK
jgi:hypothetical protein